MSTSTAYTQGGVVKLAEAYDDHKLPEKLAEELQPFAKTDRQIRIFIAV